MKKGLFSQSRRGRARAWLAGLPALLMALPALAQTEAQDFSDWECKRCPEYFDWQGQTEFGIGWVSDDSPRFGNYRGLDEKGAYPPLDGFARIRNAEGRYLEVRARDLGLDSRELEARGGHQGRYELRFAWNEIPSYRGIGTRTPFTGQGTGILQLPPDWVSGRTTGEMLTLRDSLSIAPLKLQRKTLDAGLTLRFTSRWRWDVDAQRQDKSGTRQFGGAGIFLNNAALLPAPVDFTTDILDIGLGWTGTRAQFRVGFYGSWFDNGRGSLTWGNPFTSTPETAVFRSALEPDNEYQQLSLTGAYAITPRIHLSGHAAVGEMRQDEAFLPYSINPDFEALPLPRQNLDGKVDTGVANLGGKLVARVNSRLSITARAKYDERDNRTPVDVYTPVTSDVIILGPRSNRPYGFERTQLSADVRYRLQRSMRVSAGARRKDIDRTLQAVEETEETTWWAEAKWTPLARSQVRLLVERSEREVSDYQQPDAGALLDHPLMRKYYLADRDRDRVLAELYLTPTDALGVSFSAFNAEDEYDASVIGLQSSEVSSYTISANYSLGSRLSIHGFLTRDDIESVLLGTNSTVAAAWTGLTDDRITTAGVGLTSTLNDSAKLRLEAVSAESRGDINVDSGEGEEPFPALRTDLTNIRLFLDYQLNEQWGYRLMAEYEDYSSSDWAIDGIDVDGIDSVLTLGMQSPDYSVWHLSARATYRF